MREKIVLCTIFDREVNCLRPIALSPRLMALARRVPNSARFADVGTDHGRLPVWLLEQGVIASAIATDLREGPLDKARQTAARHALTGKISFRLGDGLVPVRAGEADVIAVAGMGGETIASILDAAPWTRDPAVTLLLQPMTSIPDLRTWLSQNGYLIQEEELVREGETLYVVLAARAGKGSQPTPAELWVGRPNWADPLWPAYLEQMTLRAERALEGLRRSVRPEDALRRVELENLCRALHALREENTQ